MSSSFDPHSGLVVVTTRLRGQAGETYARLALDTGASQSVVSRDILTLLGCELSSAKDRIKITTGSGVEFVRSARLSEIHALGQKRLNFYVLCHTLPPSASVDGLLGLDFLRGHRLTIDFRKGWVNLTHTAKK